MRQSQAMSYLSQTEIPSRADDVSQAMCKAELNKLYEVLCSAKSVCIICGSNFGRYTAVENPRTAYGTCNVCRRGSVSVMHVDAFNGLRDGIDNLEKQLFPGLVVHPGDRKGLVLGNKRSKLVDQFLDVCEKSGLGGDEEE